MVLCPSASGMNYRISGNLDKTTTTVCLRLHVCLPVPDGFLRVLPRSPFISLGQRPFIASSDGREGNNQKTNRTMCPRSMASADNLTVIFCTFPLLPLRAMPITRALNVTRMQCICEKYWSLYAVVQLTPYWCAPVSHLNRYDQQGTLYVYEKYVRLLTLKV